MKNAFGLLILCSFSLIFVHCASDDSLSDLDGVDVEDPQENPNGNNNNNNNNGNNNGNGLDDRALPFNVVNPSDNPANNAKVALGRLLFWDPVLSGEKDVACATCHHPEFGYGDGRQLSIGVAGQGLGPNREDTSNGEIPVVKRNAPTIINTAFNGINQNGNVIPENAPMFWDNRASSLEEQALGPIQSFEEMRGHAFEAQIAVDSVVARLRNIPEYQNRFQTAFGNNNSVTADNVAKAIAAFERTIIANNSPFDQYARGDDNALTNLQLQGLDRFDDVGCDDCHSGPMFSDYDLHTLGVPDNPALGFSDDGANGTYAFRTPTLRNLGDTGPFFHNGVAGSLNQVLNFYRRIQGPNPGGNNGPGNLNLNPNVNQNQIADDARRLRLNQNDVQAIVAFLGALNDNSFDKTIPPSVPSGLNVGGAID